MNTSNEEGEFLVSHGAVHMGTGFFPCITVEYVSDDDTVRRTFLHIKEHGVFATLDAAYAVCKTIQVADISSDGVVHLMP